MADKVTMLDMILLVESEVSRLQAWESMQGSRFGKKRELAVLQALVRALDGMLPFEREILQLIRSTPPKRGDSAKASPAADPELAAS